MISFKNNHTSLQEIADILFLCDNDFIPALSKIVDILSYSNKIFEKAEIFGAYESSDLCGFLAMYCNNFISRSAFISLICILPQYRKLNIGLRLCDIAILHAKASRMRSIELKVGVENTTAINLYQKIGFETVKKESGFFVMVKLLNNYSNNND